MSKHGRQQTAPRGGASRTRSAPLQAHREPPQRGTTRRGGHSAYAGYPHQQFAADRTAEAAKTRAGHRAPKWLWLNSRSSGGERGRSEAAGSPAGRRD
jgi:hypothetical protein